MAAYDGLGARFAKWRATLSCGEGLPTDYTLHANAHAMARYAALCQEADIVPIVEPEVLMDGTHTIEACEAATARMLQALYAELADARVDLAGSLLKVNMVVSGKDCPTQAGPLAVAEATVRCLTANVPVEVPGIVFLSGGQSDQDATVHLNEMNRSNRIRGSCRSRTVERCRPRPSRPGEANRRTSRTASARSRTGLA